MLAGTAAAVRLSASLAVIADFTTCRLTSTLLIDSFLKSPIDVSSLGSIPFTTF